MTAASLAYAGPHELSTDRKDRPGSFASGSLT